MKPLPLLLLVVVAILPARAEDLRDPMRPPQPVAARGTAPREAGPAVTAVFSAGGTRRAIFNGRLVKADDTVGGYLIEAVLADGVRYRKGGVVAELHLPRSSDHFKTPATGPARVASGVQ